jgi:ABC-type nickel/cobalt efflux system permease component RcnA
MKTARRASAVAPAFFEDWSRNGRAPGIAGCTCPRRAPQASFRIVPILLMIGLLSILALGFFLGMRHATDPDHVIAVSTIVTRQPKTARAALIGAFWGLGHTVTIFVVGSAIILFNVTIPARIGLSMELSVGVMLIFLGILNVVSFFRSVPAVPVDPHQDDALHSHHHSHGDYIHRHPHAHQPEVHPHAPERTPVAVLDRALGSSSLYQNVRPLMIGIVHGLAGSAAVALLVLATIRDPRWAIAYLLVFGVGTIAGMMVITMSLASALKIVGSRSQNISRNLAVASGVLSLAFGCLVVYQIGFVNGLFTTNPIWTPK